MDFYVCVVKVESVEEEGMDGVGESMFNATDKGFMECLDIGNVEVTVTKEEMEITDSGGKIE